MSENLINVEIFASISGVSNSDKTSLIKMNGLIKEKTYDEWYVLVSKDFTIPKDLRKQEVPYSKSKEILEEIKKKKEQK